MQTGEPIIPASALAVARKEIRTLQWLSGKKIVESESLKAVVQTFEQKV
ncbi:hypothetical protein [Burkholderia sp. MSMB1589WGS]|nr:hypothetical protein [Burkholderia sp. MSMB1589WGS]